MKSCHTWKVFASSCNNRRLFHNCWCCLLFARCLRQLCIADLEQPDLLSMFDLMSFWVLVLQGEASCRASVFNGCIYPPKLNSLSLIYGFIFGWHTKKDKKGEASSIDVCFMLISYVTNQLRNVALRFIVHEKIQTCPSSQWGSEALFIRVYKQDSITWEVIKP